MKDQYLNAEAASLALFSEAVLVVGSDGRIQSANSAVEDLFLYPRDELIGAEVEILVPSRFAGGHRDLRRMRSARGAPQPKGLVGGIIARRKDGSEIPIDAEISMEGPTDRVLVFCSKSCP